MEKKYLDEYEKKINELERQVIDEVKEIRLILEKKYVADEITDHEYHEELRKLEQILNERDIYLRGLATGEIQGPPTGVPSIDRPYLKFYSEENVAKLLDNKSAYQQLIESFKSDNDVIIEYYNQKYTVGKMKKNIDRLASAFQKMGLKAGDVVSVLLPNIPEAYFIIYALNKIGVSVDLIDLRFKSSNISNSIKSTNPKMIICFDMILEELDKSLADYNVDNIVSVSALESFSPLVKAFIGFKDKHSSYKMKNISGDKIIPYGKLFKSGDRKSQIVPVYNEDQVAFFEHTSGTSGVPKTVAMPNRTLTALSNQYRNFGFDLENYNSVLNIIPPFMAYGLNANGHFPFTIGMKQVLIPKLIEDEYLDQLIKHKPSIAIATTKHWQIVMNKILDKENELKKIEEEILQLQDAIYYKSDKSERLRAIARFKSLKKQYKKIQKFLKSIDFSNLHSPAAGGDSIDPEFERKINALLKRYNCPSQLCKGYGLTEVGSTFTTTSEKYDHGAGSVGIPFSKNRIKILDEDMNEVGYGENGEIFVDSPSLMLGYFNNENANSEAFVEINGKKWFRTFDIGSINEDGEVTILGRKKRMIITDGGNKAFPVEIETVLRGCPYVKDVCVVGVPDPDRINVVKAHIVLTDISLDTNLIIEKIRNYCKGKLKEQDEPVYYEVHESLPITANGKNDYKLLEEMDSKIYSKSR